MSSQSLPTFNSQTSPVEVKVEDVLGPSPDGSSQPSTSVDEASHRRLTRYLKLLGIGSDEAAGQLAESLIAGVSEQGVEHGHVVQQSIQHFEEWSESLAEALGLGGEAGRVGLACLSELGRLLEQNPALLSGDTMPQEVMESLKAAVGRWPRGVLPVCAELDMHRQPLGELPMVLRGEFWSGTYRWVVPSNKGMRQQVAEEPAR